MKGNFSINESLWVRGEEICSGQANAIAETRALRERGAKVFLFKGERDRDGIENLRRMLWKTDTHVVLSWLHPKELNALRPLLEERKNFSLLTDDWYIHPYWFTREAEYLMFRKYNGIAVRRGLGPFLTGGEPPLLINPRPYVSSYTVPAAILRPFLAAAGPAVEIWQKKQREEKKIDPSKLIYFPFAIDPTTVPVGNVEIKYDFANTGGMLGIFLMRDPYAPFRYSFGNLYYDRKVLADTIARFNGKPFNFYDCRHEGRRLNYQDYRLKNHQSRFLIASGGLHDATVPKYMEYACVGTPMIGRGLPYEYPWLDDCLFTVDMLNVTVGNLKPLLHQAMDSYSKIRQNCLEWRERLLKMYSLHTLLDMVQEQADGLPVRPGYLKPAAKAGPAQA